MAIVAQGLTVPATGPITTGGYGLTVVDPNAAHAALTGHGTITATLTVAAADTGHSTATNPRASTTALDARAATTAGAPRRENVDAAARALATTPPTVTEPGPSRPRLEVTVTAPRAEPDATAARSDTDSGAPTAENRSARPEGTS